MSMMEFSKAFDIVSQRRLVDKLRHFGIQGRHCGIKGRTNYWIKAFLEDNSQRVVVEGDQSCKAPVKLGLAKGLFLLYFYGIQGGLM